MLFLLWFFFPSLLKALYNVSKPVPPLKSPTITSESENVRNLKGSAAKGPQEKCSEEKEFLVHEQVNISLKERHISSLIGLIVLFSNVGVGFKTLSKVTFYSRY